MAKNAYEYESIVGPKGKVEVTVPMPPGTKVDVLVLTSENNDFSDLVFAASGSLEFWDNPFDDEDWNHA